MCQPCELEKRESTSPRTLPPASSVAEESPQPTPGLVICGTTQVQAWNYAEVDRGGQQRGENIGDKMVIEGGQGTSSLVIYIKDLVEATKLRMGRRLFRTTAYGWDR